MKERFGGDEWFIAESYCEVDMHREKYGDWGALICLVLIFIGIDLLKERCGHGWEDANHPDIFCIKSSSKLILHHLPCTYVAWISSLTCLHSPVLYAMEDAPRFSISFSTFVTVISLGPSTFKLLHSSFHISLLPTKLFIYLPDLC